jgi:serine/threonine protein kinase
MKKIPNYTIEREIGEGGMATVYLAVQDMLQRYVAIKVMRPELTQDKNFRQSFLSEGSTIANLEHTNIIRIHDIGITDDTVYYMAMEYLSGGSLKERLDKGKLSYSHTVFILEEVANGLAYAHKKGYIHRDIKPANILFRDDGIAVLSDFGLAKLQDSSGELTRMGFAKGTIQYMSPEQAVTTDLDQRSDIYSLGLVFYEMLTGNKAFLAESSIQAIHQHTVVAPPSLPVEYAFLQPVLDKVLAKSPDQRYQNVSDFIKAIKTADSLDIPILQSNNTQNSVDDTAILYPSYSSEHALPQTKKKSKKNLILLFSSFFIFLGSALGIYQYGSFANDTTHIHTEKKIELAQLITNKEEISLPEKNKNSIEQIKQEERLKQKALEDELVKQNILTQERIREEQREKEVALEKQKTLDKERAREERKIIEIEQQRKKILDQKQAEKEKQAKEIKRKQQQLARQRMIKHKKEEKEKIRKKKMAKEKARKKALAKKQHEEKKIAEKKEKESREKNNQLAKNHAQIKVSVALEGRPLKTYIMITKKGKRIQIAKGKSFAVFNLPLGQYTVSASYNGKKATAVANLEKGDIIVQKFSFKKSMQKKNPSPSYHPDPYLSY